ncbi:hypothetical protein FisN_19Lh048 [Fistulifera solaris]|uniref:Uncharacterized protein n=1 Tax=Fistulifera solaris TaxID=1519565 RepID=A0A1Z5JRS9_FISSO|nr:hypothetical protein FisN_19Lh048 [Fistulifera solaris]|eukprot:GAX16468.1 hypothetical protein FisN_19Lh048 [Fistulifera solaris]
MMFTRSLISYFLGCSGPTWNFRVTCDADIGIQTTDGHLDVSIPFHRLEMTALHEQEYQVTWQCCVCIPDDDTNPPQLVDYFGNGPFLSHCQVQPDVPVSSVSTH